ncbi:methyltransferase-like protein 7A isoform X2 [Zingiber officinale]|uniref:methyltransferase-like protein 7A isoform X2 n=1 Tax=Zingiber officinale TaxID=94328 RepID=UPI001C4D3BFF|nr:methyltransferase-like protein 7A isoform X2 [Zingiber officinale]
MQFACCNHVSSLIASAPIQSPTAGATPSSSSSWRLLSPPLSVFCPCCRPVTKRRLLLGASTVALPLLPTSPAGARCPSDPDVALKRVHPPRPDWYEEFYAKAMDQSMQSYESEVAVYKKKLFTQLSGEVCKVLELGVGTGPNFRYYAGAAGRYIVGVDPNKQMEKYARASAEAVGLQSTRFSFVKGVGEALNVEDNTMDAVIGTLVLCSVSDVALTLRDGSFLRFAQNVLDPLQQIVADGCHLTRETGKSISEAGFSSVNLQTCFLSSVSIISPHVYGIACK